MLGKTFESIKFTVQSISVVLSVIINALLIYLIITKSPKKMGTYRHLMIYFCCFSIFFSVLDIILQPNIHTYKSAFFMIIDNRDRGFNLKVAEMLIYALCGCVGITIYGIAIHFIYRYFALERQGRLRFFKQIYLPFWFAIPIIAGICWFSTCILFFPMNPRKSEYIKATTKEILGIEIGNAAYASAVFYPLDQQGVEYYDWDSFIGFGMLMVMMGIPLNTMLVVGWKSWRKIKDLVNSGESEFTRNLQMQLYKALVAQTLIPIVLLFIPFGIIFVCPIFEIPCQFMSAPITFVYAVYPAVDPLPIFYFVDNYRNAVSDWICPSVCKKNRVGVASDSQEEEASEGQNTV